MVIFAAPAAPWEFEVRGAAAAAPLAGITFRR
jgi:hypothetical protein